jgi:hypothetical protein
VRLVPVTVTKPKRQFGAYRGQAGTTDAFFEPLPEEELKAWEGSTAAGRGARRPGTK